MRLSQWHIVLIALVGLIIYSSVYTVGETEQVIVTLYGKVIGKPINTPGLKWKIPIIYHVNRFPKNLLSWDGDKGQVPTKDKTFIWVDVFARWRIIDPLRYFEKVRDEQTAIRNLNGIIDAAIRNLITSNNLIETVRNTDRKLENEVFIDDKFIDSTITSVKLGRSHMETSIMNQAKTKLADFGIELVDVRFKRINYVEDVLLKVYERMIAERKQIAEKYRSEGMGESQKILGEKEKELQRIQSEAYKIATSIKGEADATATNIYAAAYNRDPEFYSFLKTLQLYRKSMDSTTSAVFSTKDNQLLKYFKGYSENN